MCRRYFENATRRFVNSENLLQFRWIRRTNLIIIHADAESSVVERTSKKNKEKEKCENWIREEENYIRLFSFHSWYTFNCFHLDFSSEKVVVICYTYARCLYNRRDSVVTLICDCSRVECNYLSGANGFLIVHPEGFFQSGLPLSRVLRWYKS